MTRTLKKAAAPIAVKSAAKAPVKHKAGTLPTDSELAAIVIDKPFISGLGVIAPVPDAHLAEQYVQRNRHGMSDFELLDYAMRNGRNVLMEGETQTGKTTCAAAFAAWKRIPFFSVSSTSGTQVEHYFGQFVPREDEAGLRYNYGGVAWIFLHGGCILINEARFLHERLTTALFPALDWRREITLQGHLGEVIRAHRPARVERDGSTTPCWCDLPAAECERRWVIIIADTNPVSPEYAGTREFNAAFLARFSVPMLFDYDVAIEKELVKFAKVRDLAAYLRGPVGKQEFPDTPIGTGMLVDLCNDLVVLGVPLATDIFADRFASHERSAAHRITATFQHDIEIEVKRFLDPVGTAPKPRTVGDYKVIDIDVDHDPGTWGVDWVKVSQEDDLDTIVERMSGK